MSRDLYASLAWLAPPGGDFKDACRALPDMAEGLGRRARWLAGQRLDGGQLNRLGKVLQALVAAQRDLAPLIPFRLGVLGTGTLDLITPALVASAARHGVALDCVLGGYDQALQDAISADSAINAARPQAVLIALDHHSLPLSAVPGDRQAAETMVNDALGLIGTLRAAIRQHSGAACIVQTVAKPAETLFGSLDRSLPGTLSWMVETLNRRIADMVHGSGDLILDIAGTAELVGLAEWHSPGEWNLARLPFAHAYAPLYADHVARLLGALCGKARKCLILDLDNTVWGGVIGDDGLKGINIAQGDAVGEAHRDVQKLALQLRERGIVLAVSSKNTDGIARLPFREHPDMLLKEDHIAVFQANWNDKAANIRAIAETLNLGLDAMVFLDDNPAERDLVRGMLPEVAVPELPDDPALFARTLAAGGYFEAVGFSAEDRARSNMYQENARRVEALRQSGDMESYLRSLDMAIAFAPFDALGRARIAQLVNKTNQFNLTGRRYTEAEIAGLEAEPDIFTLQARLTDRFGDNGMISVVICRPAEPACWEIDTWLMSCRVLGRRVETMVLREILLHARQHGITRLRGLWHPTPKNGLVREHYAKLGFQHLQDQADGTVLWELGTDATVPPGPLTVRRSGFADIGDGTEPMDISAPPHIRQET